MNLLIRGIFSAKKHEKKHHSIHALSVVDQYLEHGRVLYFHHSGKELMYISSADFMVRNLDHRVEAACPIMDFDLKSELKEILSIQFSDNVKARVLDAEFKNNYVDVKNARKFRSQEEILKYLQKKTRQEL